MEYEREFPEHRPYLSYNFLIYSLLHIQTFVFFLNDIPFSHFGCFCGFYSLKIRKKMLTTVHTIWNNRILVFFYTIVHFCMNGQLASLVRRQKKEMSIHEEWLKMEKENWMEWKSENINELNVGTAFAKQMLTIFILNLFGICCCSVHVYVQKLLLVLTESSIIIFIIYISFSLIYWIYSITFLC